MADLESIELGSDHEPSVGVGRVGWMNRVLLPNERRVTFIPALKLPPLALDSTDLAKSSRLHGISTCTWYLPRTRQPRQSGRECYA